MNENSVIVIDYGMGNLLSVQRALQYVGASVLQTNDPRIISKASRLVLPGVGAFKNGMNELGKRGLDIAIKEAVNRNALILGICLGMQLLFDESEEFGLSKGLGLIPGQVTEIPKLDSCGLMQKIPHIGWNELVRQNSQNSSPLLCGIEGKDAVYFVHSYRACPTNTSHVIASTAYGGNSIAAIVQKANILGCQFHPEKSGPVGLKILKNFLSI